MTAPWIRAGVELALACAAAAGCALSWSKVVSPVQVAPVTDGEPVTTSVTYNPQLLMLVLVLAAAAGVLAVVGTARLWRARRADASAPAARVADGYADPPITIP